MLLAQEVVLMDTAQYAGHDSAAAVTVSERAVSSVSSGEDDSTAGGSSGGQNEKDHGEKQSNVSRSKSDSSSSMTPATPVYVTELGCHDVLLGRGTGPCSHEGNVKFRDVIETMRPLYVATPSRKAKTKVVLKTVQSIKAKNGRFLRKVNQRKMKGSNIHLMPPHLQMKKDLYEVVTDEVAFEKTKQAIRYVHYRKDADGKQLLEKTNGKDQAADHQNMDSMSSISPASTARRCGEDPQSRSALFASFSPGERLAATPLLGHNPFSSSPTTTARNNAPTRGLEQPGGIRSIPGLTNTLEEFLPRPSLTAPSTGSAIDTNAVWQQLLDCGAGATRYDPLAAAKAAPQHQPPSLSSTIANALVHHQQEEAALRVARQDAAIQSLLHQQQEANANHHIQQAKHHLEQAVLQKTWLTPAPAPPPPPVGADLLGSLLLGRSPSTSLSVAPPSAPSPQQPSPVHPSTGAGLGGINHAPLPTATTAGDARSLPSYAVPPSFPDRGSSGGVGPQAAAGGGEEQGFEGGSMTRPDCVLLQHAIEDPTIRTLLMADDKCRKIIESYSKN